jgi:GrpB-like predicted nucleotidyltransferase (UPF0157 family)
VHRSGASEGGFIFSREPEPPYRTHHVPIVRIDDDQWQNYLRFRDRLRADPELRRGFSALKTELAERFADDRLAYTAAKAEFVEAVLA